MDPYIKLARQTIEQYLKSGEMIDVPKDVPIEFLEKRAGVFICFKNKGQLRGCIGTFMPTMMNIAQEIIQNTISAATEDNRFMPVSVKELDDLQISIDVLSEPVKAEKKELDPKKYGVLVRSNDGYKSGLLLPDLDGVDTVDEQIAIACKKAGITSGEPFSVYKFTVERHGEK